MQSSARPIWLPDFLNKEKKNPAILITSSYVENRIFHGIKLSLKIVPLNQYQAIIISVFPRYWF